VHDAVSSGAVSEGAAERAAPDAVVDCRDAVHELYQFLDGALTEENRQRIARHLDRCGHCGGAAAFEAELRKLIANRCRDRVPDGLRARVASAIEEERRHSGTD